MSATIGVEHCLSFINCQLQPPAGLVPFPDLPAQKYAVTISRQAGCGAHVIAEKLANYLQSRTPTEATPWTVFDRNLVERVLEDHHLPTRLAKFMPEDRVHEIDDFRDELFGLHPPSWTLVQQTTETILRLVEFGNVIILGRGANIIAADAPCALHVRLVSSLDRRIERRQHLQGLDRREAAESIRREDLGRQRYIRKHFNKDIDDPLLYHLVLNTDCVSPDAAARFIGDLLLQKAMAPA
jgi:cytidylate kinase